MNLPAHTLSILDTALRVPPLFVMDEILKSCFGVANSIHVRYSNFLSDENPFLNAEGFGRLPTEEDDPKSLSDDPNDSFVLGDESTNESLLTPINMMKILMYILVYIIAMVAFLLTSRRLQRLYLVAASLVTVAAGYQLNMATMQQHIATQQQQHPQQQEQEDNISQILLINGLLSLNLSSIFDSLQVLLYPIVVNCALQGALGYLFTQLYSGHTYPLVNKLVFVSFLLPSLSVLGSFPTNVLLTIPLCSALLPLAMVKYSIVSNVLCVLEVVLDGYHYARRVMTDFGLHALLESEWVRLNVPNVLRTFWLIRVTQHVANMLAEYMYTRGDYQAVYLIGMDDVYIIFKAVMIQGCETAVALLGMTSVVSYVSHYVGVMFQMILLTVEDDERSMGTVCAILFFILAEQSGLTVMEGEKRFVRLCRNFCLLFTAMLHFIHNMVNPVLMSLSASCNPAMYRHIRALFVCLLLFSLPIVLLYILWSFYPLSTWLLAVSAFSIQVVVKTLVSVLIYSLFLLDAYRNRFWERLDDYVYYISAFGNSVEFVFGILLFFNGAWIYFFESGGSIRAFMMCIHAYFNIWCEARNGWTVFIKRRTAVKKINSLPVATEDELSKHDDVCAICFQDLNSARITKCNHYFHSVCLRKWLYVQDSCPLCHEILYKVETPVDNPVDSSENNTQGDMTRTGNNTATSTVTGGTGEVPGEGQGGQLWGPVAEHGPGTAEMLPDNQLWGRPNVDVILGERMHTDSNIATSDNNRAIVIDNEFGEATIHHLEQVEHTEQDNSEQNNMLSNVVRRRRENNTDDN